MEKGDRPLNDFQRMLGRVNLQNVSTLFQTGCIQNEVDSGSLEERENIAVRILEHHLKKCVPESAYSEVVDIAMEYANVCSEIFFTVGMKAGAKLEFELLNDSLKDN